MWQLVLWQNRLLLIALGAAAVLAFYGAAFQHGAASVQARWDAAQQADQRRLHRAAEDIAARALELERARAELLDRRHAHEDQIRAGGPAVCRPDPAELRALRQRWGQ